MRTVWVNNEPVQTGYFDPRDRVSDALQGVESLLRLRATFGGKRKRDYPMYSPAGDGMFEELHRREHDENFLQASRLVRERQRQGRQSWDGLILESVHHALAAESRDEQAVMLLEAATTLIEASLSVDCVSVTEEVQTSE